MPLLTYKQNEKPCFSLYQGEVVPILGGNPSKDPNASYWRSSYGILFPRTNNSDWNNIDEGKFVIAIPGYNFVYKTCYKKTTIDGEHDILSISIDARFHKREQTDIDDPYVDRYLIIDIKRASSFRECLLSIDLGNTRTVSLLVDKIDGMAEEVNDDSDNINIYPVPMNWHRNPNEEPLSKPFESLISTENTKDSIDLRCSFLRLGGFAVYNNRQINDSNSRYRYTLSSPKRYYWDNNPCSEGWVAANYGASSKSVPLDNPLANELVSRLNANQDENTNTIQEAKNLPPAAMLSAMVVELYEQAVYYVSSKEFKDKTHDDHPRKISTVHITYPSTLSAQEKEIYQKVLQDGLYSYLACFTNRATNPVRLCSDIDEATAVLAFYVFSEIKKHIFAKHWIQTIGHHTQDGSEARIAVIDIGGGTTDLSISNVSAFDSSTLFNPSEANIDVLYRDGFNSAGDNFVLDFLHNTVAKKVLKKIVDLVGGSLPTKDDESEDEEGKASMDTEEDMLLNKYNDVCASGEGKGLMREFWYNITIGVAKKCDEEIEQRRKMGLAEDEQDRDEQDSKDAKANKEFSFSFSSTKGGNDENAEVRQKWSSLLKHICKGGSSDLTGKELRIPITPELIQKYKNAVLNAFFDASKAFGRAICAFDTDILLFSGKTADFCYVRRMFEDYAPVREKSIERMSNFKVGYWCPAIADQLGRISDSKYSTALGGALYTLKDRAFVTINFDFPVMKYNPKCEWGVVANLEQPVFLSSLSFPNNREIIPLVKKSLFISRKNACTSRYILSYQLRVKSQKRLAPGASVTVEKDPYQMKLNLCSVKGNFIDGTELKISDLEWRVCNATKEFGLDNETL